MKREAGRNASLRKSLQKKYAGYSQGRADKRMLPDTEMFQESERIVRESTLK